jgi:glycerol kinase
MEASRRDHEYDNWKRAVERTFDWIRAGEEPGEGP